MSEVGSLFLDTNVLVYNFDHNEPVKAGLARALLSCLFTAGQPLISAQVISEFYWNVTRSIGAPLDHAAAVAEVNRLIGLTQFTPMTWPILEKALEAIDLYQMPLWDAQIFAAAVLNGADVVLSEDFQVGRTIEGVTFHNPFASGFNLSAILSP